MGAIAKANVPESIAWVNGAKRLLPQSGNAIFRRGIRAYGKIASNRLESFKRVAKFQALKLGSIEKMVVGRMDCESSFGWGE